MLDGVVDGLFSGFFDIKNILKEFVMLKEMLKMYVKLKVDIY